MVMSLNEPYASNSWGRPDRYYADERKSGSEKQRSSLITVERVLKEHDPELRERVERAFKRWNSAIREYLRNETALRLSMNEETRPVPVRIVAGLPRPFYQVIEGNTDLLWLLLNQERINRTAKGMEWIEKNYDRLSQTELLKPIPASYDEMKIVRESVAHIAAKISSIPLINQIKLINEDILGAYFFRMPKIELYWMVIGIIAATLGVTVEGLTIVVAIHELAHAYSHVGMDIDGENWETNAFARADIGIVEGLSQFYTAVVCEKLVSRIPSALEAYKKLLDFQTGPYKAHLDWSSDNLSAGEIIRVSMIQCRSRSVIQYPEFKNILEMHQQGIKRRGKKQQYHRKND